MTEKNDPLAVELQTLLSDLIDSKLSEKSQARLREILSGDIDAQDEYRRLMAVHALLYVDFSGEQAQLLPRLARVPTAAESMTAARSALGSATTSDGPSGQHSAGRASESWATAVGRSWNNPRWRVVGALASLAASMLFICWWYDLISINSGDWHTATVAEAGRSGNEPSHDELLNKESRAVAVLGQASRAIWSNPELRLSDGASLPPGKFKLEKGLVQLEFVSGASVIIEAPAQFELISPNRVICNLGKVRAHVPSQAIGFTIVTPTYAAVDLGTDFTVQVEPTGASQYQVLQGKVDLRGDGQDAAVVAKRLTTGQGVRSTAAGQLTEMVKPQSTFVGTEQLLAMASAAHRERYDGWKRFSQEIRSAPNVIFYYGFDGHEPWDRVLRNDGTNQDEMLDGAIVGCQWTAGRWPGKQALEFKRTTDRVRVNVPGEFESLTYTAWLRIEGLERWLSSLMLTDGHQPGEVHWQMTDQGQLMLGVKAEPHESHDFYSPSVIGPKDLGRWVHLACVYNGKDGYVSHYLDGVEVSRENVRIATRLRLGPAEIGNWVPQDLRAYRIRSLNGRIDEFILFNTPLTAKEMRSIYEAGKPQL